MYQAYLAIQNYFQFAYTKFNELGYPPIKTGLYLQGS